MAFDSDADDQDTGDDLSPQDLRAQLAQEREARQRAEQEREREQRRLDEFLKSPKKSASSEVEALPPMPDPVEEPGAYRQWLIKRDRMQERELEERFQSQDRAFTEKLSAAERNVILWQQFQSKYPAYAAREELAGVAFSNIASSGSIPKSNDEILAKVKREMDRIAGAPLDKVTRSNDRTGDLSAGERPTPKTKSRGRDDEESSPKTLHEIITDRQIELGLI